MLPPTDLKKKRKIEAVVSTLLMYLSSGNIFRPGVRATFGLVEKVDEKKSEESGDDAGE